MELYGPHEERELSPEEQQRIQDMLAVDGLRSQPGWAVLVRYLEEQRQVLFDRLTYERDVTEISRMQGAVHALNLFFGTTESLLQEGAFYRQIQRPSTDAG